MSKSDNLSRVQAFLIFMGMVVGLLTVAVLAILSSQASKPAPKPTFVQSSPSPSSTVSGHERVDLHHR